MATDHILFAEPLGVDACEGPRLMWRSASTSSTRALGWRARISRPRESGCGGIGEDTRTRAAAVVRENRAQQGREHLRREPVNLLAPESRCASPMLRGTSPNATRSS